MINLGDVVLRALETKDVDYLYAYRNDWEVVRHLGGFSAGYSRANLQEWIKVHSNRADEVLWTIADALTDQCIGHVGLYQIDSRVRKGQFAIMIGDRSHWGKGVGTRVTQTVVSWAFAQLNLHKVSLHVLSNNDRAVRIYELLGFRPEGILRDEQFRDGQFLDLIIMAVFEDEWRAQHGSTMGAVETAKTTEPMNAKDSRESALDTKLREI
jgi:ribosomal-protein-alanine N-acetyltransferase